MKVWKSTENKSIDALELPTGRYAANFGFLCEQSVSPDQTLTAAEAIIESGNEVVAVSQAGLICKAQELEVAFTDWAPLHVF